MKLLSIIIPFYNSEKKCAKILRTILQCAADDVEFILVDDGSRDGTFELLEKTRANSASAVTVVSQSNKGPGGARNSGLKVAAGEYLWFVDSDDDICLDVALLKLRLLRAEAIDFIDFTVHAISQAAEIQTMALSPGHYCVEHNDDLRMRLLRGFGRLWSKIFRRSLFERVNLTYPEYCIWEDNSLLFALPLLVRGFVVCEEVGYLHDESFDSVTRGEKSDLYFDRIWTAKIGYSVGSAIANRVALADVKILKEKYSHMVLWNTGTVGRRGLKGWVQRARVLNVFRVHSKSLSIDSAAFVTAYRKSLSPKGLFVFWGIWLLSYLLINQDNYFRQKRRNAWGRDSTLTVFVDIEKARILAAEIRSRSD